MGELMSENREEGEGREGKGRIVRENSNGRANE